MHTALASGLAAIFAFLLPFLAASPGEAGACLRAAEVPAGDRVILAEPVAGSREVRLAGILTPDEPDADTVAGAHPLARQARAALAEAVDGHCLDLVPERPAGDRYGRLVAALRREEDGLSLQDELVRRGLARVLPGLGNPTVAASLLASEEGARRAGRGLWANARYRVRTTEEAAAAVGSYQLVEGRVVQAMRVGPRLYLNFGEDWQTDFTVVIAAKALPRFAAAGIDPAGLAGRTVRVRGLIEDLGGPLIEIDEPAALQVLEAG